MDIRLSPDCIITVEDGEGYAIVNGREWRWEFHRYCGPMFLRKDGEPLARQPGESHPVWIAFDAWLEEYEKQKEAKTTEGRT